MLGEADDETEIMGGGEAVEFGFLLRIARAPHGTEAAESPALMAGRTVATRIKNGARIAELTEIKVAVFCVDFAVAGFAHRGYAVEGVGTHFGANEDIVGMGKAEEMARLIRGKFFIAPAEDFAEIFFQEGATETEAIKTHAVNGHICEGFCGATAEIFPATALEDAVKILAIT